MKRNTGSLEQSVIKVNRLSKRMLWVGKALYLCSCQHLSRCMSLKCMHQQSKSSCQALIIKKLLSGTYSIVTNTKRTTPRHMIENTLKAKDKEKTSREKSCHIQRNPNMINSCLVIRNSGGQKTVR